MTDSNLDQSTNPALSHLISRRTHWDQVARKLKRMSGMGGYYHQRLQNIYKDLVSSKLSVLEIGCGEGDLLAALEPKFGVGVDISGEMLKHAQLRNPTLHYIQADGHDLNLAYKFDVIVLSDLLNDVWDVQALCEQIRKLTTPETRIFVNSYSRLWQLPLALAGKLGLAKPQQTQNWLTPEDISNLLGLSGFEVIKAWPEIVLPIGIPLLSAFANRILARMPIIRFFALTNFFAVRPVRGIINKQADSVSVIIPARNEEGNIDNIFKRIPKMGSDLELVFIEGHSNDDTYEAIKIAIEAHPERQCQLHRQTGIGKGDAVRLGFEHAQGDILMILDADLTVPPEDLPRFYDAIRSGIGEFINGVRLVYPMEDQAMRFLNFLGNKFFSLAFTWLLGQPVKDTLCGTKVLRKSNYELIAKNRSYFGDFDPFGDYDLLFGATRLNLKIVEVPIRYRQRTYGDTNIQRWQHGWLLLKMVAFAAVKIKFR